MERGSTLIALVGNKWSFRFVRWMLPGFLGLVDYYFGRESSKWRAEGARSKMKGWRAQIKSIVNVSNLIGPKNCPETAHLSLSSSCRRPPFEQNTKQPMEGVVWISVVRTT